MLSSTNQESDQEVSSGSDESDKTKDDNDTSNSFLHKITDLSCSVIINNHKMHKEHEFNMSQSFNEKLLQEKCVLEDGVG